MPWPVVTRKVHDLEMDALRATLADLVGQRDEALERETYWRTRAERLTDAALARAGAIHEPTMVERKPPAVNPMAAIAAAMSVREVETSKSA